LGSSSENNKKNAWMEGRTASNRPVLESGRLAGTRADCAQSGVSRKALHGRATAFAGQERPEKNLGEVSEKEEKRPHGSGPAMDAAAPTLASGERRGPLA
jgi:hypothetical protein